MLVNSKRKISPDKVKFYLKRTRQPSYVENFRRLKSLDEVTIYSFTTDSFFYESTQGDVLNLFRGHRLFSEISKDELLLSLDMAGEYLLRCVNDKGKFIYKYEPQTDSVPKSYNILRHSGTIYSMLELYELTGNEALLDGSRRAIKHLLEFIEPCIASPDEALCVVEDGYVKLGGNALAIVALTKYTELTKDKTYMSTILKLGKWIQNVQNETGEFLVYKQTYPEGTNTDFVSDYYPGEALFAMMLIYELNNQEEWLDSAELGAQYLINIRDKDSISEDHWLVYALGKLYKHRPKLIYLDHALKIAHKMVNRQIRNPKYPKDWIGGYYRPPRSTSCAIRTEALCIAYELANKANNEEAVSEILEAIRLGIMFQLQTQFRNESILYLNDPSRALGGFHKSLTDFEIRIDYVQHNISSLIGLYRILCDRE